MTPNLYCYFDYLQTADSKDEPLGIGGYVPVEKVYSLDPTAALTEEQAKHILGAQANLWTEYIATTEHAEYMILPRMAALAEVQWTQPEKKDYADFTQRLPRLIKFYQRDSMNYAKNIFDAILPNSSSMATIMIGRTTLAPFFSAKPEPTQLPNTEKMVHLMPTSTSTFPLMP